jgi:hypothetical protein
MKKAVLADRLFTYAFPPQVDPVSTPTSLSHSYSLLFLPPPLSFLSFSLLSSRT